MNFSLEFELNNWLTAGNFFPKVKPEVVAELSKIRGFLACGYGRFGKVTLFFNREITPEQILEIVCKNPQLPLCPVDLIDVVVNKSD
jgi:hypothetical protein